MNTICYSRSSSINTDLEFQQNEIRKFCKYRNYNIVENYTDVSTLNNNIRPGFRRMMRYVGGKKMCANVIIILELSAIGKNLYDILKIIDYINFKKLHLIVINDDIDTTGAQGKLFYNIAETLAEYERTIRGEKRFYGGVRKSNGRPRVLINIRQIEFEVAMGLSKNAICRKYSLKRSTLYTKLGDHARNNIISTQSNQH